MTTFASPPRRSTCTHRPTTVDGMAVIACAECGEVSFHDAHGFVASQVGIARLFGQYDLVESLPALGAPAPQVLLYRPPTAKARRALAAFPANRWMEGDDGLWISHDGFHLLLAHNAPWISHHLFDGA